MAANPSGGCIRVHEAIFLILGCEISIALAIDGYLGGWTLLCAALTLLYAGALACSKASGRSRFVVNYLAVFVLYSGSTYAIDALAIPQQHEALRAMDVRLFGVSPAFVVGQSPPWWIVEMLSAGYLSYQVYLHWVFIEALFKPDTWRESAGRLVFTAFGIGFIGYLLMPASPPYLAFPSDFDISLDGFWMHGLNQWINTWFAARYDAFPSLHILVTLLMLARDRRHHVVRFRWMLLPSCLMIVGTLVLRFHYAMDLVAACVLFVPIWRVFRDQSP